MTTKTTKKEPKTFFMPLNCGDYLRKTQHLGPLEHGCYQLLRIHYWENEGRFACNATSNAQASFEHSEGTCLTISIDLYRVCNAHTVEERKAVDKVVAQYFPMVDGKHTHSDLDDVLQYVVKQKKTNSTRGTTGANARWEKERKKRRKGGAESAEEDDASSNAQSNAQAMALQTLIPPIGIRNNPPKPLTVDKPVDNVDKPKWDVLDHINDPTIRRVQAIAKAKNLDFYFMVRVYNDGMKVNGGQYRDIPDSIGGGFVNWARSYTKDATG